MSKSNENTLTNSQPQQWHQVLTILEQKTQVPSFTTILTDKKTYHFRQLSTTQFQQLLQTVVEPSLLSLYFETIVFDIMKTNFIANDEDQDQVIDIFNRWNLADLLIFTLDLRIASLGSIYIDSDTQAQVDLKQIVANLQEQSWTTLKKIQKIKVSEELEIDYSLPLCSESLSLYHFLSKEKQPQTMQDLQTFVGKLVFIEIARLIHNINVQEKESQKIAFSTLNWNQKIDFVQRLPFFVTQQLLNYLTEYRKFTDQKMVVSLPESEVTITIPFDGTLFTDFSSSFLKKK